MKNLFYLSVLCIFALNLSLTSCTEDQLTSSKISVDTTQVATVAGIAYAELDLQKSGKEFAPAGTSLLITVPYSELNSDVEKGNWEEMITVGENGTYSVEVPSNNKGVTVTITPTDFTADLKLENNSQFPTQTTVYTSDPVTASVKVGLTSFSDINYTIKSKEELNFTAMVYGKVTGELDLDNTDEEALPSGTIITFIGKKDDKIVWSKDFSTSGKNYEVQIPAGVDITAHWNFKASKNIPTVLDPSEFAKARYSYVGNATIGNFAPETDNIKDFSIGGGISFNY